MSTQVHKPLPKLHNAMWPGLVGKGSPGAEPCIDLDTMLDLTARAEVNGVRFDGVDLFLFDPHVNIDLDDDGLKRLADKIRSKGFVVGSVVAPVWAPTGGGSAMGTAEERKKFVEQVGKACRIARTLRELGVRPYGVVRIDSACGVAEWAADPELGQGLIAQTFSQACDVAADSGERLAAEGEICWGGMHSWKRMVDLLERVNRPRTLGFQADMAHTLLYVLGYNAPEDALLPADGAWSEPDRLDEALKTLTNALRPWTLDFHVAQNDGTVKGSGTHDKTGHHCLPGDPNGKLDIPRHAGYWLRDESGQLSNTLNHMCWDGCMFPNSVMLQQDTWNDILRTMISVRDAQGWGDEPPAAMTEPPAPLDSPIPISKKLSPPKHRKPVKKPTTKLAKKPLKKATKKPAKKPMKKTTKKSTKPRANAKAVRSKSRKSKPTRKPASRKAARPSRKKAKSKRK